jgi:glycosyltransferase involved in cell wall biosynthesis
MFVYFFQQIGQTVYYTLKCFIPRSIRSFQTIREGILVKVGVVLPVYNQVREYLAESIGSLESQIYRNFKLIIVIDGANAETVEAVYAESTRLTMPYEIIDRKENRGIAYSLNEGFNRLRACEYLTWVSSDNRHNPDFLRTLVEKMDSSPPQTVLVYSTFSLINEHGNALEDPSATLSRQLSFMNRPKDAILQLSFIGASFLYRKDAYFQTGGYNPAYEKAEDHEFWMRLLRLGEIVFIPRHLMEYRLNGKFSYTTVTSSEEISLISARASYDNRKKFGLIPSVSVIITVYNQRNYLKNAIDSVLRQTFQDFQLIIVDDGSTDGSWETIHNSSDSRILPIHISHKGQVAALNTALRFALGRYVIQLDGDDWYEPNCLEIMVSEMDRQGPNVALAYANRRLWYDSGAELIEGPVFYGRAYKDKYEVLTALQTHCPRLYRRAVLEEVGGWPTEIAGEQVTVEDFYMMLLLAEKYSFHYVNALLYNQRRHNTNITVTENDASINQIKKIVTYMLQRWGNVYVPEFGDGPLTVQLKTWDQVQAERQSKGVSAKRRGRVRKRRVTKRRIAKLKRRRNGKRRLLKRRSLKRRGIKSVPKRMARRIRKLRRKRPWLKKTPAVKRRRARIVTKKKRKMRGIARRSIARRSFGRKRTRTPKMRRTKR